jgi:hypothetical protein
MTVPKCTHVRYGSDGPAHSPRVFGRANELVLAHCIDTMAPIGILSTVALQALPPHGCCPGGASGRSDRVLNRPYGVDAAIAASSSGVQVAGDTAGLLLVDHAAQGESAVPAHFHAQVS